MRFWALIGFLWWTVFVTMTTAADASRIRQKRSFTDKLHNGIKLAGSILGIDTAADVANLVAKAFGKPVTTENVQSPNKIGKRVDNHPKRQNPFDTDPELNDMAPAPGILSNMLKIIGLDSSKIGAMAVNGIIFIAQMVREGLASFGSYMKQHIWDWSVILEYIVQRIQDAKQPVSIAGV